ncbi:MAG: hypothetical protein HDQ87_06325 [Clostridia bacterium]|nr:hypothetical protein [Clostridia bacterium]
MRKMQTRFVADISKYTENFFLGMSPRQTVFGILGGAVILLGSYLLPVPQVVPMLVGFAIIMFGFFQPEGIPLEKYIKAWWDSHFTNPITRHYESDNIVYDFLWRGEIGGRTCFRPADYLTDEEQDGQTAGSPDITDGGEMARQISASAEEAMEVTVQDTEPWMLSPEEAEGMTPRQIRKAESQRRKAYNRQIKEQNRAQTKEAKAARAAAKASGAGRRKLKAQPGAVQDTEPAEANKENSVDYRRIGYDKPDQDWRDAGGGNGSGYSAQPAAAEPSAAEPQGETVSAATDGAVTAAPADMPAEVNEAGPAPYAPSTPQGGTDTAVAAEPQDSSDPAEEDVTAEEILAVQASGTDDQPYGGSDPAEQDVTEEEMLTVQAAGADDQTAYRRPVQMQESAEENPAAEPEDIPAGSEADADPVTSAAAEMPEDEDPAEPQAEAEPEPKRQPDRTAALASAARNRRMQERLMNTMRQERKIIPLQGGRSREPGDYRRRRAGQ